MQHLADAQEPGEEPQHGRAAARPCSGLPGHHGGRGQQLHQRGAHRQLPPAGRLRGDAAPAARHHHGLLAAGVRLRVHLGGHAEPAQPVQLSLGKRRGGRSGEGGEGEESGSRIDRWMDRCMHR